VREATVIVRARPSAYATEPKTSEEGERLARGVIRFDVLEVLKGHLPNEEFTLSGYLANIDDFNDRPVPYDFVRPGGRHGNCFAESYRRDAEHLLFIIVRDGRNTAHWAALAPTNEQLTGNDDAWLTWVRKETEQLRDRQP